MLSMGISLNMELSETLISHLLAFSKALFKTEKSLQTTPPPHFSWAHSILYGD